MRQIIYSWFTEEDADAVADLMVRNHFWMGRIDPQLNGRKLLDYQEENGVLFGVVGKAEQRAVSYVAGYRKGSQRVCTKRQILMSGLVIDRR